MQLVVTRNDGGMKQKRVSICKRNCVLCKGLWMIMTIRMISHYLLDSLISCSLIKLSSHHFFSFY